MKHDTPVVEHRGFPPGPRDYCLGMRTMARMKRDVLGTYAALQREYGDAVSFVTGPYRIFIFFHPDQVREVLVTQSKSWIRFPHAMQTFAQWNGNSILIAEGDAWVRQRRLVQPAFQPRRMEHYGHVMVDATCQLVESWQPTFERQPFIDIDLNATMTGLALKIICRTLFNFQVQEEDSEIAHAVAVLSGVAFHEMQALVRLPNWWPTSFYRRKRTAIRVLDEFIWKIIRNRRQGNKDADQGDLLSTLLTAVDDQGDGGRLTDRQVRDEAMTLMLAGHDTTAAALDWLWIHFARYPEIQERCRQEIHEVLPDRLPTTADCGRLTFLDATIKESLRLYPPAIGVFLRQTIAATVIGGYRIPPSSLLAVSSYVTQRDPRWFPDPEKFDPERFLPPRVEAIPPVAYFPFGAGPRVCIGQAFASVELLLIAATILQRCKITNSPNEPDAQPHVDVALRPTGLRRVRICPVFPSVAKNGDSCHH